MQAYFPVTSSHIVILILLVWEVSDVHLNTQICISRKVGQLADNIGLLSRNGKVEQDINAVLG
jgi:hypothetical protein